MEIYHNSVICLECGTYGKDGNEPLHYIKLKDMDDDHLDILKDTHEIYTREIKYRKSYAKRG